MSKVKLLSAIFVFFVTLNLVEAQKKKKLRPPFQWNNPLKERFEKLGVVHGTYESKANQATGGYNILLPKVYSSQTERRFPVVYLLHGGRPGDEGKLLSLAPVAMEAIDKRLIPPAIFVFVNGGPVSHYDYPGQLKNLKTGTGQKGNTAFVKELIPHIDKTYRTIAERKGRVLEGYSQGGRGTLRTAFRNPELFIAARAGSAGVATELRIKNENGKESESLQFSPGDDTYSLALSYSKTKKEKWPLKLLLYTGDTQKDFNSDGNKAYSKFLKKQGIPHELLLIPDCKHSVVMSYEISGAELLRHLKPVLEAASKP